MKPWMIAHENHLQAAEIISAAISPYLDYIPICEHSGRKEYNAISLRTDEQASDIKIIISPSDGESQSIEIAGKDEINLLYAAYDFQNICLPHARYSGTTQHSYYLNELFSHPFAPYEYESSALIQHRGLWLWGHTIYNYRSFIDHMVALKLNTLILWNDFPPINISAVIDYAHENGIAVYLGFAWGWDTQMPDSISDAFCQKIASEVLKIYMSQYANLKCDGIYLQSFTENMPVELGDVPVIDTVVALVNRISGKLWEKNSKLQILFGLHAGCALPRLNSLKQLDSRISIIWEDVGAFPYAYTPTQIQDFESTIHQTKAIRDLRSGGFGAVLKGVICLDWNSFAHQKGTFVMGTQNRKTTRRLADERREILRWVQAAWLKNAGYAQKIIREFPANAMITCLVEDGLFEEIVNLPTALYASMLWNSNRALTDILYETALRPDVDFI